MQTSKVNTLIKLINKQGIHSIKLTVCRSASHESPKSQVGICKNSMVIPERFKILQKLLYWKTDKSLLTHCCHSVLLGDFSESSPHLEHYCEHNLHTGETHIVSLSFISKVYGVKSMRYTQLYIKRLYTL